MDTLTFMREASYEQPKQNPVREMDAVYFCIFVRTLLAFTYCAFALVAVSKC